MKVILIEIVEILKKVPNMDRATAIGILNPIETEEEANNMLNFLKGNINDKEIMRISFLIPNKRKIIKGIY